MAIDSTPDDTNVQILPDPHPDITQQHSIHPIDIVNSFLPQIMSVNWYILKKPIGFMNISKKVIQHIRRIAQYIAIIPDLGKYIMKLEVKILPFLRKGETLTNPTKPK